MVFKFVELYEYYLKNRHISQNIQNMQAIEKISKMFSDIYTNCKDDIFIWTDDKYRDKINKTRKFFKLPPYYGDSDFYGFDISLLHIKNQKKTRLTGALCCIGTTFKNCEFTGVHFTTCIFVTSVMCYTRFHDCEFENCSIYEIDPTFHKSTQHISKTGSLGDMTGLRENYVLYCGVFL